MAELFNIEFDFSSLLKAGKITKEIQKDLGDLGLSNKALKSFKDRDKFQKDFNKKNKESTKELEKQNKLLDKAKSRLKDMKATVGKGLSSGALGGAGALFGGAIGGSLVSAITSLAKSVYKLYEGTLSADLTARNMGISNSQLDALKYAGKQTGFGEDYFVSEISKLNASLSDINSTGAWAALGLNRESLSAKKPIDAYKEVLSTLKSSNWDEGTLSQFLSSTGLDSSFLHAIRGSSAGEFNKYYGEGVGLYTEKKNGKYVDRINYDNLKKGERIGNRGETRLDIANKTLKAEDGVIKLYEKSVDTLNKATEALTKFAVDGIKKITSFVEGFAGAKDKGAYLKDALLKPIVDTIKGAVVGAFNKLGDWLHNIWESLTTKIGEMFNSVVEGLKSAITDMIPKGVGSLFGFGKKDKINDGIITNDGRVVHTDPKDYILAMKRPGDLVGAGGNYNININATVRNDNDVVKIKRELENLLRSFNNR